VFEAQAGGPVHSKKKPASGPELLVDIPRQQVDHSGQHHRSSLYAGAVNGAGLTARAGIRPSSASGSSTNRAIDPQVVVARRRTARQTRSAVLGEVNTPARFSGRSGRASRRPARSPAPAVRNIRPTKTKVTIKRGGQSLLRNH